MRNSIKTSILLILVCIFIFNASALFAKDNNISLLDKANNYYQAGKYSEAITSYEELLNNGIKNPYVFYNLGNAYNKKGLIGKALLSYYRAERILPRDQDIKHNIEFVKSKLKDIEPVSEKSIFLSVYRFLNINEWAILNIIIFFISMGLLFLFITKRNEIIFWVFFSFLLILFISSCFFGLKIYHRANLVPAVVMKAETDVRNGPGVDYTNCFKLHEGSYVEILRNEGGWDEIKYGNLRGWASEQSLEKI